MFVYVTGYLPSSSFDDASSFEMPARNPQALQPNGDLYGRYNHQTQGLSSYGNDVANPMPEQPNLAPPEHHHYPSGNTHRSTIQVRRGSGYEGTFCSDRTFSPCSNRTCSVLTEHFFKNLGTLEHFEMFQGQGTF